MITNKVFIRTRLKIERSIIGTSIRLINISSFL